MTQEQLVEICRMMDINKDGLVDLNEFLETFRMVDPESRTHNQYESPEQRKLMNGNRRPSTNSTNTVPQVNSITTTVQVNSTIAQQNNTPPPPPIVSPASIQLTSKSSENGSAVCNLENIELKPKKLNSLTTSPVLSSRRGSQI